MIQKGGCVVWQGDTGQPPTVSDVAGLGNGQVAELPRRCGPRHDPELPLRFLHG